MADAPKDQKQQTGGFMRWVGIVNEGIGNGVKETLAGLGFVTVDAINNAPRLLNILPGVSGVGKMTERPIGGSDWIRDKYDAGKRAADNATGVVAPVPQTTGERVAYTTASVVTQVVAPMAAARLAQTGTVLSTSSGAAAQTTSTAGMSAARAAASTADDISLMAARRIANGNGSTLTKLELLTGKGPAAEGQIEKMFALMRKDGLSEKVYRETVEALQRGFTSIPADKAKTYIDSMRSIFTQQQSAGWLGGKIDGLRATFDFARNYPGTVALDATRATLGAAVGTKLGRTATLGAATAGGLYYLGSGDQEAPGGDGATPEQLAAAGGGTDAPAGTNGNGQRRPAQAGGGAAGATPTPTADGGTDPAGGTQVTNPPQTNPAEAGGGTTGGPDIMDQMGNGLSTLADGLGLTGLWNSSFMRGIRQWAVENPAISRPLMALGGFLLANKLMDNFMPQGVQGNSMGRILMVGLAIGVAFMAGSKMENMLDPNKGPASQAFARAGTTPPPAPPAALPAQTAKIGADLEQEPENRTRLAMSGPGAGPTG